MLLSQLPQRHFQKKQCSRLGNFKKMLFSFEKQHRNIALLRATARFRPIFFQNGKLILAKKSSNVTNIMVWSTSRKPV